MDKAATITLIATTFTTDAIGQRVPSEPTGLTREVYARKIESITRTEWATAGQMGFQAEYRVTMFLYDYEGEGIAEVDGKRYAVYRTYHSAPDEIELYLGERAGTK